jgi:uncharacterized protein (TIGR02265 family)
MTEPRIVGGKVVAGLYGRALSKWLTPEVKEALKGAGIEAGVWARTYSYQSWIDGLNATSGALFPDQLPPAAMRSLGHRVVLGLREAGVLKGAYVTMAKFAGPRRVLKQLDGQKLEGAEFLEPKVIERGSKSVEVELAEVSSLSFLAGALEAALEALGVRDGRVDTSVRGDRGVLTVSWS